VATDDAAAAPPTGTWVLVDVDADAMGAAMAPAMMRPATPASPFFMTTPLLVTNVSHSPDPWPSSVVAGQAGNSGSGNDSGGNPPSEVRWRPGASPGRPAGAGRLEVELPLPHVPCVRGVCGPVGGEIAIPDCMPSADRMGAMSEDAAAPAGAESSDRDAVRAALMAFGRRYLHALESQGRSTGPFGFHGWGSHPQAPDMFAPLAIHLPPSNFDEWDEYRAIEALVQGRPSLRRLITQPMYAPPDQVPDFRGLLTGVVAMAIERYQAIHGSDDKDLAELIDELADWFCRDADPMFVAVSVVGFTAPGPLSPAPGITVRRASDEEVSAMLDIGALNLASNPNRTQGFGTQVHEAARWVVAMDHSRPRRFGGSAQPRDEPDLSRLEAAAGAWLAVLRILTPAEVRLGPTLTRQLVGGIPSGGSLQGYVPRALFAWHNPATITPDKVATFAGLAQQIVGGRAKRLKVEHGLRRFSDATTRADPTDRLVDLVIALESMFSDGGDSISYKVSRRASAMFAPLGLSARAVFEFVKAAYSSRSKIVHSGAAVSPRNLAGEQCPAGEQVGELDRLVAAIFRQILSSSSSEQPYAMADELINTALDSHRHPPATGTTWYTATVTRDGNSFVADPRVGNTYWVRGATVEQLRKRLADTVALWTQTPCGPDQILVELDDHARAASP
jgi:hypothetical protein